MRKPSRPIVWCIIFCALVSGCKFIPEEPKASVTRDWSPAMVDKLVVAEEIVIPAPAPVNPVDPTAVPDPCNSIRFLRYRLRNTAQGDPVTGNPSSREVTAGATPVNMADIDAVLLLMPGVLEGNTCFRNLGRQLVYIAKTERAANIELWAFDRRPNCAEDLTGLNVAEQAHDTRLAIDYYWNGKTVGGKVFPGYLKDKDLPYLSEFGLKLIVDDLYTIITTMVPDQSVRQRKVFVGGHSLAGFITAVFAGWDFDGNPATLDDAGYKNCAGFVALDTVIASMSSMLEPFLALLPEDTLALVNSLSQSAYGQALEGLRSGTLPRVLPLSIMGLSPEAYTMIEIMGMRANWAPKTESTVFTDIPYSANINFLLRLLHSKDAVAFLAARPSILDTRYTNEALLGTIFDDNFMPINIMQSSMGFIAGEGAVVAKNFPLPGALNKLMGGTKMFIADETGNPPGTGPLYSWANFDQIGNASDPVFTSRNGLLKYTTMAEEVSDIQDFAPMLFDGPSNLVEWYFPMRLMLDLMVAGMPWNSVYGLNFLRGDAAAAVLPKIGFIGTKGAFTTLTAYMDEDYRKLEGYNHFDVLTAAADRNERRPNEVIDPLIDFVLNPK